MAIYFIIVPVFFFFYYDGFADMLTTQNDEAGLFRFRFSFFQNKTNGEPMP